MVVVVVRQAVALLASLASVPRKHSAQPLLAVSPSCFLSSKLQQRLHLHCTFIHVAKASSAPVLFAQRTRSPYYGPIQLQRVSHPSTSPSRPLPPPIVWVPRPHSTTPTTVDHRSRPFILSLSPLACSPAVACWWYTVPHADRLPLYPLSLLDSHSHPAPSISHLPSTVQHPNYSDLPAHTESRTRRDRAQLAATGDSEPLVDTVGNIAIAQQGILRPKRQ